MKIKPTRIKPATFYFLMRKYEQENRLEMIERKGNDIKVTFKSGLVKCFSLVRNFNSERKFFLSCYKEIFGHFKEIDLSKLKDVAECETSVNFGCIDDRNDDEIIKVDINRCYFNVAHVLGFITDEAYEKYDARDYKFTINVAIGCTASRIMETRYEDDGSKKITFRENPLAKIRANILDYVAKIYYEVANVVDVEYYHTDCFFIRNKNDVEKIYEILAKHGLTAKIE